MSQPKIPYSGTPPTFRVSMFTAQQGDLLGGWSENFWCSAGAFASAKTATDDLYDALLKIKDPLVWMPSYRVSSVASSKQVYKRKFGKNFGTSTSAQGPSVPTVKALIYLAQDSGVFTTQWLGGLATTNYTKGGGWNPLPSVATAINGIYSLLAGGPWCIRKLDPANAKMTGAISCTQAGVVTYTAHGLATGNVIRIGAFLPESGVNGIWQVTVTDANTFSLKAVPGGLFPAVPAPTETAYFRKLSFTTYRIKRPQDLAIPPGDNGVIRATEHRIGRPFGQYSGRRRKVKK